MTRSGALASRRVAGGQPRRGRVTVSLAAGAALLYAGLLAGAWPASAAGTRAAAPAVRWGRAVAVPGLVALNAGGNAQVFSVSCWSAGNCAAGGFYTRSRGGGQAFVVTERNGRWETAVEVPGSAALNEGHKAHVGSVSCARSGACVAIGTYTDQHGNNHWFVTNERNGQWTSAAAVPTPVLNQAVIGTVWCAPGGLCAAGGWYTDPATGPEAWVATETHGRWQPGLEVPGIAALNVNGSAFGEYVSVDSVACASAGNCAVGGQYTSALDATGNGIPPLQAFVATETNGTWGSAREVPGTGALNGTDSDADTTFMACPSAGNCTAAGYYQTATDCDPPSGQPDAARPDQGPGPLPPYACERMFLVNQRHGTWGQATASGLTGISALTCPAAGDCVAAGSGYRSVSIGEVISETSDRWHPAVVIARTGNVDSVSCASAGNCGITVSNLLVASERGGRWAKAEEVPGLASLNKGGDGVPSQAFPSVNSVSCPSAGYCTAAGYYTDSNRQTQAFVGGAR